MFKGPDKVLNTYTKNKGKEYWVILNFSSEFKIMS